ncbi:MAG: H-type lectin domain-containing protein [Paracoccus sp. (in: a-proteobacteria)]
MLRFSSSEIGISQGVVQLVSDFDTNGPLWTGEGDRSVRQQVVFPERFLSSPAVHVSASMWDLDTSVNQRGDLSVENITPVGFEVVFKTWGDSRIARMRVQWTAIGPLPDDDDFAL